MSTRRNKAQWRDPADTTPGPTLSGVRARVVPADEVSSNESITARPPPLDYDDELSAQTVMRKLPEEFLAKLKQSDAFHHGEPVTDDDVTRVGPLPVLPSTPSPPFSMPIDNNDESEATIVAPLATAFGASKDEVHAAHSNVAKAHAVDVIAREPKISDTAHAVVIAANATGDLEVPAFRPRRDALPFVMLGLGLGLIALLAILYSR